MEPPATPGARTGPGPGLSAHILPTSATMIGVCLTALYISLLGPSSESRVLVDKLLAMDGLVFLGSALLSFVSMRVAHAPARYERLAESVFIGGLGLLALGGVALAFVVT